jgi:hypothetical protein
MKKPSTFDLWVVLLARLLAKQWLFILFATVLTIAVVVYVMSWSVKSP